MVNNNKTVVSIVGAFLGREGEGDILSLGFNNELALSSSCTQQLAKVMFLKFPCSIYFFTDSATSLLNDIQ